MFHNVAKYMNSYSTVISQASKIFTKDFVLLISLDGKGTCWQIEGEIGVYFPRGVSSVF